MQSPEKLNYSKIAANCQLQIQLTIVLTIFDRLIGISVTVRISNRQLNNVTRLKMAIIVGLSKLQAFKKRVYSFLKSRQRSYEVSGVGGYRLPLGDTLLVSPLFHKKSVFFLP